MIPNNACALRLTAAAGTELAGASSGGTVNRECCSHPRSSSPLTVVYTPKGSLPHAASLRQPCGHCAIFPTAASRRSLGRISVPMWRVVLSDPLRVIALVSRYLTNKLIGRGPIQERPKPFPRRAYAELAVVSNRFSPLLGRFPRVTHPCATVHRAEARLLVRLACVKHAASVRPEPGSNSPSRSPTGRDRSSDRVADASVTQVKTPK